MTSIADFTVRAQDGTSTSLEQYAGKVVLVVNTATGCGFTPQYKDLERIYQEYQGRGMTVLDFPCNQFGDQAPGSDTEIQQVCTLRYGTTFPRFAKVEVNGPGQAPLFAWLKEAQGFSGLGKRPRALALRAVLWAKDRAYASSPDIKWNFTKFLVGRDGTVLARFEPTTPMSEVEQAVVGALGPGQED